MVLFRCDHLPALRRKSVAKVGCPHSYVRISFMHTQGRLRDPRPNLTLNSTSPFQQIPAHHLLRKNWATQAQLGPEVCLHPLFRHLNPPQWGVWRRLPQKYIDRSFTCRFQIRSAEVNSVKSTLLVIRLEPEHSLSFLIPYTESTSFLVHPSCNVCAQENVQAPVFWHW